jgi:hypothetical protein
MTDDFEGAYCWTRQFSTTSSSSHLDSSRHHPEGYGVVHPELSWLPDLEAARSFYFYIGWFEDLYTDLVCGHFAGELLADW